MSDIENKGDSKTKKGRLPPKKAPQNVPSVDVVKKKPP